MLFFLQTFARRNVTLENGPTLVLAGMQGRATSKYNYDDEDNHEEEKQY